MRQTRLGKWLESHPQLLATAFVLVMGAAEFSKTLVGGGSFPGP